MYGPSSSTQSASTPQSITAVEKLARLVHEITKEFETTDDTSRLDLGQSHGQLNNDTITVPKARAAAKVTKKAEGPILVASPWSGAGGDTSTRKSLEVSRSQCAVMQTCAIYTKQTVFRADSENSFEGCMVDADSTNPRVRKAWSRKPAANALLTSPSSVTPSLQRARRPPIPYFKPNVGA
ncbi:hypothetical protein IQ07DRAFT_606278 [Pyrenochaeta sp. DS3sAY3a]|nr:hypothetical protein IQ07DRAFT_606278 [Pyrenochaeta sp. DS3sAY3a]